METTRHRCTARAALEINSSKCAGFLAKQTSEPGDEVSKGASNSAETGSPQSPPAANGRGSSGEAPPSKPRVTDFPHRCESASHQGSLATQAIRCQHTHQATQTEELSKKRFPASRKPSNPKNQVPAWALARQRRTIPKPNSGLAPPVKGVEAFPLPPPKASSASEMRLCGSVEKLCKNDGSR